MGKRINVFLFKGSELIFMSITQVNSEKGENRKRPKN